MESPTIFALLVLTLLAVPGPTNTLLAGSGAMRGISRSLPLLVGELAGYNIAIATYRVTLGTLVSQASGAETILKWAIAGYLVFLAIRLWRVSPKDGGSAFTIPRVFLTTLLNPKALIFALFIFPARPTSIGLYFAGFAVMVVAIGASWIVAGALVNQLTRERYTFVAPRICALALAVFAVVLASGFLK